MIIIQIMKILMITSCQAQDSLSLGCKTELTKIAGA